VPERSNLTPPPLKSGVPREEFQVRKPEIIKLAGCRSHDPSAPALSEAFAPEVHSARANFRAAELHLDSHVIPLTVFPLAGFLIEPGLSALPVARGPPTFRRTSRFARGRPSPCPLREPIRKIRERLVV